VSQRAAPPPLRIQQQLPRAAAARGAGFSALAATNLLVEIIELPSHPWFVGVQFHPEFTSTPRDGHPLFSRLRARRARLRAAQLPAPPAHEAEALPASRSARPAAVPDRRPLRHRVRGAGRGSGRAAEGITAALGIPSSSRPPTTRPTAPRAESSAARAWRPASRSWPRCEAVRRAGADRRARRHADRRGRSVVDVLQTPAFLCRQTDFIRAVARRGKPVNIKKGQFLSPWDMKNVVDKARAASGGTVDHGLRARRFSFGYNNLVSDMRALAIMRETGCPVVFDATHSVQLPGGQGTSPAASANSCRCWRAPRWPRRRRRVHGNASRSGQGAVRRPQRLAALMRACDACSKLLQQLDRVAKRFPSLRGIVGREILDSRGNPTVEVDVCSSPAPWAARPCPRAPPPARARRSSCATATRSATAARAC
jgi:hypothetical protein